MAIVMHMRVSISKKRPYGPEQARAFQELLSANYPDQQTRQNYMEKNYIPDVDLSLVFNLSFLYSKISL